MVAALRSIGHTQAIRVMPVRTTITVNPDTNETLTPAVRHHARPCIELGTISWHTVAALVNAIEPIRERHPNIITLAASLDPCATLSSSGPASRLSLALALPGPWRGFRKPDLA